MKFVDGDVCNDDGQFLEVEDLLQQLSIEVLRDSERWFEDVNHHTLELVALCLAGEVGELCNYVKKVNRGGKFVIDEGFLARMDEEAVDTFIYLLKYAALRELDLLEGYMKKREKNEERFG